MRENRIYATSPAHKNGEKIPGNIPTKIEQNPRGSVHPKFLYKSNSLRIEFYDDASCRRTSHILQNADACLEPTLHLLLVALAIVPQRRRELILSIPYSQHIPCSPGPTYSNRQNVRIRQDPYQGWHT